MALKEEKQRIVRRRVAVHDGGHAGGAWKLAYADFMTAMMALFLALYLINQVTPQQRKGIAEQFRMPLRVALEGGPKSSMSSSVIPGGGADPTQHDGEVKQGDIDSEADKDAATMDAMKDKLNQLIQNSPVFQQFRSQLLVDITTEGLRLQIVDSDKRPMFELASAVVVPHMRAILRAVAPMLNSWPNKVTLAGHTDSIVYASGDRAYSNWELSADRANASRRELVAGGLQDSKVLRIMGLSDSMPLDKADPRDPINRRISIVVLNARTQRQIEKENSGGTSATLTPRAEPAGLRPTATGSGTPVNRSGPAPAVTQPG
ncbi:MAG TPA: flagellar motor protein MotB [Ramlibacter sp.]|nr:flagellar motor protein MotB [Ramlibacter sp.]